MRFSALSYSFTEVEFFSVGLSIVRAKLSSTRMKYKEKTLSVIFIYSYDSDPLKD
jgi:hypothetical protein